VFASTIQASVDAVVGQDAVDELDDAEPSSDRSRDQRSHPPLAQQKKS
jgi:hypothetical protein